MLDAVTVELRKRDGGQLVVLSMIVELALSNIFYMREQENDSVTVNLPRHQLELILEDTYSAGGFERLSRIELTCYSEKPIYMPNQYQVQNDELKVSEIIPSKKELGLPEKSFIF